MLTYILKRIASLIPTLLIVVTVVFFIMHIAPGDPASTMLGEEATEGQIKDLREELGLSDPLYKQYFDYIGSALQGDLGNSYFLDEPVVKVIASHIGPTAVLALMAEIIALFIAIPLGVLAAKFRGTIIDQTFMGFSLLGISIPSFILGILFMIIFAVNLDWLPAAGYKPISSGLWNFSKYLIMPAVALGTMQAALIARMSRASTLEVLGSDFIKAARAKGTKEFTVIVKHAFKNALLPILTVVGQSIGGLITGAVVTETIFNIPGIGQLMINSIDRRDFTLVQGTVLFVTVAFVTVNLLVDLLYGVVDPRVRLDRK